MPSWLVKIASLALSPISVVSSMVSLFSRVPELMLEKSEERFASVLTS